MIEPLHNSSRYWGRINLTHLPNSGRLTDILCPGAKLYLKRAEDTYYRKSSYSVFAVNHGDNTIVIVDTRFSNYLVRKAIEQGLINELAGYRIVKENVRPEGSNTRLDFLLRADDRRFYLEV
ncbi:MAG: DNA/RNA nuclease SfsA [Candidatus Bathyarchaeia archaeon]